MRLQDCSTPAILLFIQYLEDFPVMLKHPRHVMAGPNPGHPRLIPAAKKTWMPATERGHDDGEILNERETL